MSRAYYNETDSYCVEWLRNLIIVGLIADGDVDDRSIEDVRPSELANYTQCHFFAGIGVWSHALRSARWPDDRRVWTGSCPCQPFSAAGKRGGVTDERHLWPAWFHLIEQCRPGTIFGEQVASKDGLGWLDLVQSDLEGANYTNAAFDLCAAGVGAPHIRQRLYFVADSDGIKARDDAEALQTRQREPSSNSDVGNTDNAGLQRRRVSGGRDDHDRSAPEWTQGEHGASVASSHWSAADWLPCIDDKQRPVEPGTFPLAHGAPARVGRLRAYGNAIVAPLAKEVIAAYMECRP